MNRTALAIGLLLAGLLVTGCETGQNDPKFELTKTTQERDTLRTQLQEQEARSVALRRDLDASQTELKAAQAKVGNLSDQVQSLEKQNKEFEGVLGKLKTRELKRPEVPGTPLPPSADEALQKLAGTLGDRVWYDRGRGAISFANDRLFDSGSDVVRPEGKAGLTALGKILEQGDLAEYEAIVIGHTDDAPISKAETLAKHPSNWHLSVHRAIAVKDVLASAGVSPSRLGVMGYADQRPVSAEPTQNRRVEIFIVRKGGVQPFEPVRKRVASSK
jgi:chemotaxis protein MotB